MNNNHSSSRVGMWLIGAKGGVSTTVMVGLAALQQKAIDPVGLITATKSFENLGLVDFPNIVVGGHDIRGGHLVDEAKKMWNDSRAITPQLLEGAATLFGDIESRLRPGTLVSAGDTIRSLADRDSVHLVETPRQAIDRIRDDIQAFQRSENLDNVIVVNVASTEPPPTMPIPQDFKDVEPLLNSEEKCPLPASSLYYLAAAEAKASYINFTPSVGATPQCMQQVAYDQHIAHAGCDGKTGETLLKSVLAPMFAARNLDVMSWVGHNIFGNMDGKVLDDPLNKSAKVKSKDHLLASILGYPPQTHVSIEYIESLGDWKTAWDHIHFRGFLGTPMTMQFTWQGCDSILAAPLVLDLVRLVDRASRNGEYGALEWLACFFKSPINIAEQDFFQQLTMLREWVDRSLDHTN
jgi:myo-inositol-1-phosphate synthase